MSWIVFFAVLIVTMKCSQYERKGLIGIREATETEAFSRNKNLLFTLLGQYREILIEKA